MTAKNHKGTHRMVRLLLSSVLLCGLLYAPAQSQTTSDRWLDYAGSDYDIFPNVTYAKANNIELKLDLYLASMWREFLDADTYARGPGSTVSRVADGSLYRQRLTGIAGVANTGSDRNWTGHHMAQANWYAFGRLAWQPNTPSKEIATEWTKMTLSHNPQALASVVSLMLESHEAVVNYIIMDQRHGGTRKNATTGTQFIITRQTRPESDLIERRQVATQ